MGAKCQTHENCLKQQLFGFPGTHPSAEEIHTVNSSTYKHCAQVATRRKETAHVRGHRSHVKIWLHIHSNAAWTGLSHAATRHASIRNLSMSTRQALLRINTGQHQHLLTYAPKHNATHLCQLRIKFCCLHAISQAFFKSLSRIQRNQPKQLCQDGMVNNHRYIAGVHILQGSCMRSPHTRVHTFLLELGKNQNYAHICVVLLVFLYRMLWILEIEGCLPDHEVTLSIFSSHPLTNSCWCSYERFCSVLFSVCNKTLL